MPGPFARASRVFFSPEAIAPFLIGSIALGVASNAAYTAISNQFGTDSPTVLLIAVGAVAILILMIWLFQWVIERRTNSSAPPGKKSPTKHRGLILLVSNESTCRKAIEHHTGPLERVWLICSTKSLNVAEALRGSFSKVITGEPLVVNDVFDLPEFYAAVDKIYAGLPNGWSQTDVIADFTGMTVPGSVGMVLACVGRGRPVQYVPAEYDPELKALRPHDPIEVTFPPGSSAT